MKFLRFALAASFLFASAQAVVAKPIDRHIWQQPNTVFQASSRPGAYVYDDEERVADGGFEWQPGGDVATPWQSEGKSRKIVGFGQESFKGTNEVKIFAAPGEWNALTQKIAVNPKYQYRATAWIRTFQNIQDGYFGVRSTKVDRRSGVRGPSGVPLPLPARIISQTKFGKPAQWKYEQISFTFKPEPGQDSVLLFLGYWGLPQDSTLEVDAISVRPLVENPVGEFYKINMWLGVLGSNDGPGDNKLEYYGTVTVEGKRQWESAPNITHPEHDEEPKRFTQGQTYELGYVFGESFYDAPKTLCHFVMRLRDRQDDREDADPRDKVIAVYDEKLDLPALARSGQMQSFSWDNGQGISNWLSIRVTHLGYIAPA